MDSKRWKKLEDVYQVARPMNQSERGAYLNRVCAEDDELHQDAETLLAFADPEEFLEGNASTLVMEVLAHEEIRRAEMRLLTIGEVLDGRYEISQELVGGGMGSVYKAHDRRLGWTVAVKVIREHALKDSWIVDKFRQEKEALAKIDHPNVVRLVDAGELENGAPYLVMKYVEGSDLSQTLAAAGGALEPARVAAIMQQAGQGVAALHEAGLVHRDIKPGNFVVSDNDQRFPVKVIDLGIVRVLGTSTRVDWIPGTPRYLSPEQLNGRDVTTASDVYALAVMAFELLTGRPLFDLQDVPLEELALRLSRWQQDVVNILPKALLPALPEAAQVILQSLALDPDQRPSAQAFGDELAHALTAPAPTESAIMEEQKTASSIRRAANRFILSKQPLIIVAGLLIIVLGVMLWLVSVRPERTLIYWLTVVRQLDGKPIRATGSKTFNTGDEFQFHIAPAQAGALYLFNEGTSGNWHILFPTPENHQGKALLEASEEIETKENRFTNRDGVELGTERIWMIWASEPILSLDEIVRQSFNTRGTVSDQSQQTALRQFTAGHETPLEINSDEGQSQVTLRGREETLIYLLKLKHQNPK